MSVVSPTIPGADSLQVKIDFDGDGVFDDTVYGAGQTSTYTYASPGIYVARMETNDFNGNSFVTETLVAVQDVRQLDGEIRGVLSAMFSKLRAGDIDGALTAFTPSAADRYRQTFLAIGPSNLASVIDRSGMLVDVGILANGLAECVFVRGAGAASRTFLVYLSKEGDGVWRISSM